MRFGPEVTEGFGDIFDLGQPQQADGKVAQASHHLRTFAFSNLPTVLVEGHVPYVVGTVFNGPLTPNVRKQLLRGSLLDRKARQPQDRLRMNLSRLQIDKFSMDLKNLTTKREVNVAVQGGGDLNAPSF